MNENCVNKLLSAFNYDKKLKRNEKFNDKIYRSIGCAYSKKWIANILPFELINSDLKEIIELIVTLSEGDNFYEFFPDIIETPDYGDSWGRFANYIEINNRSIAQMKGNKTCCAMINLIKLLPAIPPSAKSWANCIILSQIFPNVYGDGWTKPSSKENSLYAFRLNSGYSENIISRSILDFISQEEQIRAFNDLAHFRGLKTGFRTIISADQMKVAYQDYEENFDWKNNTHTEIYINEMTKLMNLGFECMFVDSAKHIGGYDMENYAGVGALPEYHHMQYIFNEIRRRSSKTNISFVGEKSSSDFERYKNLGLNAGTDYINGDDFDGVKKLSNDLKYNRIYAPGVEIENDNYEFSISYEQRLHRIYTALNAYDAASDKLPCFMQMNDIFPLRYDTSTHQLMMSNPSFSSDKGSENHIENLFAKEDGRNYNHKVAQLFANALCK